MLYEAEKTNGEYRIEFKRTQDEQFEVVYKKTDITDVVFFAEGEDIDGALKTQAGSNMSAARRRRRDLFMMDSILTAAYS